MLRILLLLPRAAAGVGPPRFFFTKSESKTGFQDNFERPFRLSASFFLILFFGQTTRTNSWDATSTVGRSRTPHQRALDTPPRWRRLERRSPSPLPQWPDQRRMNPEMCHQNAKKIPLCGPYKRPFGVTCRGKRATCKFVTSSKIDLI